MNSSALRNIAYTGLGLMIIFWLLSLFTFSSRAYFSDFSYISSIIIKDESVKIQEMRWGSFITHLFPLTAYYLGATYEQILWWYNLSFYTFFTATYCFLLFRWKQYDLNILLLSYFLLFVGDTFFWLNNEVHQGICWSMLGLGYYYYLDQKGKTPAWSWVIILTLIALGTVTHLLAPIPIVFILLFKSLIKSGPSLRKINKKDLIVVLWIFFIISVKLFTTPSNTYDSTKLDPLKHIKFQTVFDSFVSPHAIYFYRTLPTVNILISASIILGIYLIFRHRNRWLILAYTLCGLAYWILINIIYPGADSRIMNFYMESEYMIMGMVIIAPIIYLSDKKSWTKHLPYIFITLFTVQFGLKFYSGNNFFNKRFENMTSIVSYCNDNNIDKAILVMDEENVKKYLVMGWGLPIETLSYSKNHYNKDITVKIMSKDEYNEFLQTDSRSDIYIPCFGPQIPIEEALSSNFFNLSTNTYYQSIPTEIITSRMNKLHE